VRKPGTDGTFSALFGNPGTDRKVLTLFEKKLENVPSVPGFLPPEKKPENVPSVTGFVTGFVPGFLSRRVIAALAMGSRSRAQSGRARAERKAPAVIRMASAKWCRRFCVRARVPPITPRITVATICAAPVL